MTWSSSISKVDLTRYTDRKVKFLTLVETVAEIGASTGGGRQPRTEHVSHSAEGSYPWLSSPFVTTPYTLTLHLPPDKFRCHCEVQRVVHHRGASHCHILRCLTRALAFFVSRNCR